MILAGIDIGTNTIRLLVVEAGPDSLRELYSDRKITRLGQDLDRTGVLARKAVERSLTVLGDFGSQARRRGAAHIAAVGTSAIRNAGNAAEFIAEAKTRTGLDVRVISGGEEARLTLLGVASALRGEGAAGREDPLKSALVIDIGGGSTELIVTSPGSQPVMTSIHLGAVYLTERFIKSDPPAQAEITMLRKAVRKELESTTAALRTARPGLFVGTAGTITTLAAMDQRMREYDPEKINRSRLSRNTINRIVQSLGMSTLAERRQMAGLEPGREDIILAGAVVAQEIMDRYGYAEMLVSDWGLREGIVLDLYERLSMGQRTERMEHGA